MPNIKHPLLSKWYDYARAFHMWVKCRSSHITGLTALLQNIINFIHSIRYVTYLPIVFTSFFQLLEPHRVR